MLLINRSSAELTTTVQGSSRGPPPPLFLPLALLPTGSTRLSPRPRQTFRALVSPTQRSTFGAHAFTGVKQSTVYRHRDDRFRLRPHWPPSVETWRRSCTGRAAVTTTSTQLFEFHALAKASFSALRTLLQTVGAKPLEREKKDTVENLKQTARAVPCINSGSVMNFFLFWR